MSENSKIQWTHHTFNPWLGCTKAHAGCTNCYAESHQAVAMRKGGKIQWGEPWQGGQRVVVSESTWQHPFTWARKAAAAGERHRVFCASLSDVLEVPEDPPFQHLTTERRERANEARKAIDAARERLWDTIRQTATLCSVCHQPKCSGRTYGCSEGQEGGLDWLLLTKRPENWRLVPEDVRPLVWLGTSVSDQETADEWVPRLLATEGFRYRFLSAEPLVGPVNLRALRMEKSCELGCGQPVLADVFDASARCGCTSEGSEPIAWHRPDWVIVGGESGLKARTCNVEWVRSIVRQCAEAGVPCFVKQLGARPVREDGLEPKRDGPYGWIMTDPKGGDWSEWPEDLRVRQFPGGAP